MAIDKRVAEIRTKTVFETGDPRMFIRASDVAYLIMALDRKDQQISKLKNRLKNKEIREGKSE